MYQATSASDSSHGRNDHCHRQRRWRTHNFCDHVAIVARIYYNKKDDSQHDYNHFYNDNNNGTTNDNTPYHNNYDYSTYDNANYYDASHNYKHHDLRTTDVYRWYDDPRAGSGPAWLDGR